MESVKYFKFELDTPSRDALKLINEKNKKGVDWGKNKYYYGHSKYYYESDGTCLKSYKELKSYQIISAKEMIDLLSPKKEIEPVKLQLEMTPICNGESLGTVKYDAIMINDLLINHNIQSVVITRIDPLFIEFKKIFEKDNTLTEIFNEVKKLFNKQLITGKV